MKAVNQLLKEEAQRLFDYRNGTLYWRRAASGRRADLLAVLRRPRKGQDKLFVLVGGVEFLAKYLVWNWHHGIAEGSIRTKDGNPSNLTIGNLVQIDNEQALYQPPPYACPCCAQRVAAPTPDIIAHTVKLPPIQETILKAIWTGHGRPVDTTVIFSAMYADDPDGGPSPAKMYSAFKVALSRLRDNLEGTGVSIINEGYRQGYRLVIGRDAEPQPIELRV